MSFLISFSHVLHVVYTLFTVVLPFICFLPVYIFVYVIYISIHFYLFYLPFVTCTISLNKFFVFMEILLAFYTLTCFTLFTCFYSYNLYRFIRFLVVYMFNLGAPFVFIYLITLSTCVYLLLFLLLFFFHVYFCLQFCFSSLFTSYLLFFHICTFCFLPCLHFPHIVFVFFSYEPLPPLTLNRDLFFPRRVLLHNDILYFLHVCTLFLPIFTFPTHF